MTKTNPKETVTLVGAGLVGSLTALSLARRGYTVEVFEKRPDMRIEKMSAGKSINLAVSVRGLHALAQVGLREKVLGFSVPMPGRLLHGVAQGGVTPIVFQKYGKNAGDFIYSIPRGKLNAILMTEAENTGRVRIHFNKEYAGSPEGMVLGADGAYSAIRTEIQTRAAPEGRRCTESVLDYGYKELTIPAGVGCPFSLGGLHIWPRATFMLIALPNLDGSFTCTLFLPHARRAGVPNFTDLQSPEDVLTLFAREFPDVTPYVERLTATFFENPTGSMVTVKSRPWYHDRFLVLGDAAHAIVPFFGQGMNCGFEDVTSLMEILDTGVPLQMAGPALEEMRASNADAIADMAVANFVEMRDQVGKPEFLVAKSVEQTLMREFPEDYVSRYQLVSFTRVPYEMAYQVGQVQDSLLQELTRDLKSAEELKLDVARAAIERELAPLMRSWRSKEKIKGAVDTWI